MLLNSEFENDVWPYLLYITVPDTHNPVPNYFLAFTGNTGLARIILSYFEFLCILGIIATL